MFYRNRLLFIFGSQLSMNGTLESVSRAAAALVWQKNTFHCSRTFFLVAHCNYELPSYLLRVMLKFRYSEKATKFLKISQYIWHYVLGDFKKMEDIFNILLLSQNIWTLHFSKQSKIKISIFFLLYLLLLWSGFKSKCHFWRKNQQISKWIYVTSFTKLPIQKILADMHISINLKNKSISSIYLKARTCLWLPLALTLWEKILLC